MRKGYRVRIVRWLFLFLALRFVSLFAVETNEDSFYFPFRGFLFFIAVSLPGLSSPQLVSSQRGETRPPPSPLRSTVFIALIVKDFPRARLSLIWRLLGSSGCAARPGGTRSAKRDREKGRVEKDRGPSEPRAPAILPLRSFHSSIYTGSLFFTTLRQLVR